RSATSSSGVRAFTGGRASRISWMSPWRWNSSMGASIDPDVGGPTIPHRVLDARLAAGGHRDVERDLLGVELARRHAARDQLPFAPARQRLVDHDGGGLGLGVAQGDRDLLLHLAGGAVEAEVLAPALGRQVE